MQVNLIVDCTLEAPNEYTAKEMVEKDLRVNINNPDQEVIDIDFISIKES